MPNKKLTKKQKAMLIVSALVIVASYSFIATQVMGVSFGGNINMGGFNIINIGGNDGSLGYYVANRNYVDSNLNWALSGLNLYPKLTTYNVGIGTNDPAGMKLKVAGGPIEAAGGLIIQKITNAPEPTTVGSIWMCVDADGKCDG